jgi:hypothetical protein
MAGFWVRYAVMFAVISVSYWAGWLRGAYVVARCKAGECPVPSCENYRGRKNKS